MRDIDSSGTDSTGVITPPGISLMVSRRAAQWFVVLWGAVAVAAWLAPATGRRSPVPQRTAATPNACTGSPAAMLLTATLLGAQGADDEKPATTEAPAEDANPFPRRLDAPSLTGGIDWINTSSPLDVKDLRGKFVLLDFWTYCCINCMHILPELQKLEAMFPNELVVIGVHSAKFENEEDSKNITEAVERYEIKHPVVNDAKHAIWNRFGIRSWPTALLIDPEGKAVYGRGGEFKAEEFAALLKRAIPYYRKKGTLDESPVHFDLAADQAAETPLRFPGKLLLDEPGNRLFIADSNHNRIVVARLDGTLLATIGAGAIGLADGDYATATFNHPQGMVLNGETLYVADTENHLLRKVDLAKQEVATIAGLGTQAHSWPGIEVDTNGESHLPDRFVGKPRMTELNSPWDLLIHDGALYIAMAGPHQIWKMPLDESEIGPYAGNGREDIVDGPLLPEEPYEAGYSSFAQPSGLATDGTSIFVADSEGSSIRAVPFDASQPVRTVIGTADLPQQRRLFTFGDHDGGSRVARFQHPLGVAFRDGTLYVADTYNNKVKAIDLAKKTVSTVAGTGKPGSDDDPAAFDEPAGLAVSADKLYVADTNNHAIRVIELGPQKRVSTFEVRGLQAPVETAAAMDEDRGQEVQVAPVSLQAEDNLAWLAVKLTLPAGYKMNPQAPTRYKVTAVGEPGPLDPAGLGRSIRVDPPLTEFQIELPLLKQSGKATVDVALDYYYCRDGAGGLCKVGRVTWTVPITIDRTAKQSTGTLPLTVE